MQGLSQVGCIRPRPLHPGIPNVITVLCLGGAGCLSKGPRVCRSNVRLLVWGGAGAKGVCPFLSGFPRPYLPCHSAL